MHRIKLLFLGIVLTSVAQNAFSAEVQQYGMLSLPTEVIQNHIVSRLDQTSLLQTRFSCTALRNSIIVKRVKTLNFDLSITSEQEPQFANETSQIIFRMLMHNQLVINNNFKATNNHFKFSNLNNGGLALFCSLFNTNRNSTLKILYLNNNFLGTNATPLINALATNSSITELDLGFNVLNSNHINDLAAMILKNSTLKKLYLYDNAFGNDAITPFTNALIANTSLTLLDLGENNLKKDHIKDLAIMLSQNSTLKTLDLSDNAFRNIDIIPLTNALVRNTSLEKLILKNCDISQGDANKLKTKDPRIMI